MQLKNSSKKFHFIYVTTNLINGKIYVGQHSTNDLNDNYLGSGKMLQQSIKKYGKSNFKREILNICSINIVDKLEEFWIKELDSVKNGYNIYYTSYPVLRGEDNPMFGLLGELNPLFGRVGRKHTEEENKNHSIKMSGEGNPMFNKTHSEESIELMREAATGRTMSKENKELTSKRFKGIPKSQEYKDSVSGENNHFYGKNHTKETIELISKNRSGIPMSEQQKEYYRIIFSGEGNPNYRKTMSQEQKDKISETKKNAEYVECIYCGFKSRNKAMIIRWHNENCKHKNK